MSIIFPVVPIAPGVPPVSRQAAVIIATVSLLTQDLIAALVNAPVRWGIFLDGQLALDADSVVTLDPRKEWHVPNYPIENGNFETYNKVEMPYDVRIKVTKKGTETERATFLQTLDQISGSLDFYDIVTPEYNFVNATIVRYDYHRSSTNGVGMITATLILQEIRTSATSTFVNTAQPSGAPQKSDGVVQPTAVPGVPAASPNAPLSIDNLPGFSPPLVDYSVLGFQ